MTGTAVLLDRDKYIVLEEVERSLIDPALSEREYTTVGAKFESYHKAPSLIGFKEDEIDWDYGY